MKRIVLLFIVGILLIPMGADAHETHVYEIGGTSYRLTVGSLGEPIVVDDKTGVDFRVSETLSGDPVSGLNETVEVELIAGERKKTLSLEPVFGAEGEYEAVYFPTLPTTLTYRFFGNINDTPIDLSFECTPAGHPRAEEDTSRVEVTESVVRTLKRGGFGCPVEKSFMGFPEESVALVDLEVSLSESEDEVKGRANTALGLAVIALLAGGAAFLRRRR